jgi:hypothetical protein
MSLRELRTLFERYLSAFNQLCFVLGLPAASRRRRGHVRHRHPLFETEDVKSALPLAIEAFRAGKPRPAFDFMGR